MPVVKTQSYPNSVTCIGSSAFRGCTSLTSVTILGSVTSIGSEAFEGCRSLTSVTLDNNSIVSAARTKDTSMKTIFGDQVQTYIIGNAVTSIGKYAFYNCTGLTKVFINENVTNIDAYAFRDCSGLTDVFCFAEDVPTAKSLDGRQIVNGKWSNGKLPRGINIIRYSDGTTKKVLVK